MLVAKFFDKDNVFVEALNVESASWTRQKNKEYTFDINLVEIPSENDYVVRLIDTDSLLRVLPSGYISSTDGSRKISIKSWETMLADVGQIPENWQGWDGENLQQIIPNLCYGFRKIGFANLAQLQSYVFSENINSSELEDSNGDIFLNTFPYFNEHEIAYYDHGTAIYRIEVPTEARRQGMKLRWSDSVGDTTDISVQFRWSNIATDWTGAFSLEVSPTRSESITPNQTSGVDIPEGTLTYLFVRFNLKYDAGTDGVNYEKQITTVQGSTGNIVYYGCTPILNAFEIVYRVDIMIAPGAITVPNTIMNFDIHDKNTLLDVLKALAEKYDFVFHCSVDTDGSILLNASTSYVTDMIQSIGCISDAVNATSKTAERDLSYYDACSCYGAGSGIDRIHAFVTLPGITTPKNITTFEDDEITSVAELITAGEEYLESENDSDTVVKFGWYGSTILQLHDKVKILVGETVYENVLTEESFSFDANGLSKREYVAGIKTYPLRGLLGGDHSISPLPSVPSPSNVKASRGNDGWIISWSSTSEEFIVEYKRAAQTWWSRKVVNGHSITIPLVERNTAYTFRIYAIEGTSISLPSSTIANSGVSEIEEILVGDPLMLPNNASSVSAIASEEYIDITWSWEGTGIENSLERFAVDISRDNKTSWQRFYSSTNSCRYTFNRDVDGYPETTDLSLWFVRVRVINIYGIESSEYAPSAGGQAVTYPSYKGWAPATPSVSTRSNGRGISILWGQSNPVFGEHLYDIQIAKGYTIVDGVLTLITDVEALEWYSPTASLNPKLSYDNYKEGILGGFASRSGNVFSIALPLYGQNETPQFAQDTPYYIRVRATSDVPTTSLPNERNLGSWTSATLVYAYGSSAQDIVENAILNAHITDDAVTANKISVALLSAISANIGVITDGAFVGNENNMWAVSTVYEEDGITPKYYSGTLKAGGSNQYLHITPRLSGGVPTGEYDIDFKVGNFTVTAIGSTINGIFEIRNIADNVVYFSVDPSQYGKVKIRNSLEIGGPTGATSRETIKEGFGIFNLEFTGTGTNDMEIVEEGTVDANISVEIVDSFSKFTESYPAGQFITIDGYDNIWTAGDGVKVCFNNSDLFVPATGLPAAGLQPFCSGITHDKDNNIWVIYYGGGIYKCDYGSTNFVEVGSYSRYWEEICSDINGNIWAIVSGGHIYKCNYGELLFNQVTSTTRNWKDITSDIDGNVWATTGNPGILTGEIYICESGSTIFNLAYDPGRYVTAICSDKYGNIWALLYSSVAIRCQHGSTTFSVISNSLDLPYPDIISDNDGNVWACGDYSPIYKCEYGSNVFSEISNTDSYRRLACDSNGNIYTWKGSYIAIYKKIKTEDIFLFRVDGIQQGIPEQIHNLSSYTLSPTGTKIQFNSDTGHVVGDTWTFTQGLIGGFEIQANDGVKYFYTKNKELFLVKGGVLINIGNSLLSESQIANLPTSDQKAALAGTAGTPSASNKYVTNSDSRLIASANLPTADQKAALAGSYGTPSASNKYVTALDTANITATFGYVTNSGYYVKFSDGTMICYFTRNVNLACSQQWDRIYITSTISYNSWTFPVQFYSVSWFCSFFPGLMFVAGPCTTSAGSYRYSSGVSSYGNSHNETLIAVGRWKA